MAQQAVSLSPYLKLGPPRAPEAEQALLGALLLDAEGISKIEGTLADQDFFEEIHRRVFRCMLKLYAEGRSVDAITLHNELKGDALYQDHGGENYLAGLVDRVGSQAHLQDYARIVREKSVLRELIKATTQIYEECYQEESRSDPLKPTDSVRGLLDRAEARIFQVAQERVESGFVSVRDVIHPLMESLESARQHKTHVTGISTGFGKLDELTSGLQRAELILLAGRPGQGKTALGLNLAGHVALECRKSVAIFSLEMDYRSLLLRLLCSEARANGQKLRRGYLERDRFENITMAASRFLDADIYIDDSRSLSTLDVRSRARRLASQLRVSGKELGLLIIDYLQLMRSGSRYVESRQLEVSDISRGLKILAKDLNVPIVAMSQLSRRPEEKGREGRPQLSDLRDSGSLEQDADMVLFIYRPGLYKSNSTPEERAAAEIVIGKQRNGPLGSVNLVFLEHCTKFVEPLEGGPSDAASAEDAVV